MSSAQSDAEEMERRMKEQSVTEANYPIIWDAMMAALTCLELTKDALLYDVLINVEGLIAGITEAETLVHKAIDLVHVAEFADDCANHDCKRDHSKEGQVADRIYEADHRAKLHRVHAETVGRLLRELSAYKSMGTCANSGCDAFHRHDQQCRWPTIENLAFLLTNQLNCPDDEDYTTPTRTNSKENAMKTRELTGAEVTEITIATRTFYLVKMGFRLWWALLEAPATPTSQWPPSGPPSYADEVILAIGNESVTPEVALYAAGIDPETGKGLYS
mgnify:FL=1